MFGLLFFGSHGFRIEGLRTIKGAPSNFFWPQHYSESHEVELETGFPTLLLRIEAIGFPTLGLLLYPITGS